MATADDDFEALLREVDGVLGNKPVPAANPGQPAQPTRREKAERSSEPSQDEPDGVIARIEAGVPTALVTGVVSGAVVGGVFAILPFVSSVSGALGAFVAGTLVSLAGRIRR